MIELAQHIETLLLENDCVIVPGFGGFITHYTPACLDHEKSIFLPPCRTVGFNPQLKLNDGLLVQSYMSAYELSFPQALARVEKEALLLKEQLHEEGNVNLPSVGGLHYNIHNTYSFTAYRSKLNTTSLYGLDSFDIKPLSALKEKAVPVAVQQEEKPTTQFIPTEQPTETRKSAKLYIAKDFVRYSAAVAAAILLFFFLSTPVENTYIGKDNKAQLIFSGLFENTDGTSLITSPIALSTVQQSQKKVTNTATGTQRQPVAVKEVVVAKNTVETTAPVPTTAKDVVTTNHETAATTAQPAALKRYHVIVGSTTDRKRAEELQATLKTQGYAEAHILENGSRLRVCTNSYAEKELAEKEVRMLRSESENSDAWLHKQP